MSDAIVTYRAAMLPQSFEQVARFADMVARTAFCPQAFRNKPEECLAAITYGAELGLSPMQALRGIALINGQPAAYGDTLLAICQAHPQWGGKEERLEGTGDSRVAICIVHRKGEPGTEARFSVAQAKAAKLWSKSGPWTEYPDRMLQMRARGFALRDAFADALRGVISDAEARDYPELKDVTPARTAEDRRAAMREAEAPVEAHDPETGEVLPPEPAPVTNGKAAERGKQIAAAFRDAPTLEALQELSNRTVLEIADMPTKYQLRLAKVFEEAKLKLEGDDPMAELDDIDQLPPEGA